MRFLLPTDPDFLLITGYDKNYPLAAKKDGDYILDVCYPGPIKRQVAAILNEVFGPDLGEVILECLPNYRQGPFNLLHEVYYQGTELYAEGILDVDTVIQCRNGFNEIFHIVLQRGTQVRDCWLQNGVWKIAYPVWGKIIGPLKS